jgi:hypothetical protein
LSDDPPFRPPFWPRFCQRLAWMAVFWVAGVAVVGAVAFVLRAWIAP